MCPDVNYFFDIRYKYLPITCIAGMSVFLYNIDNVINHLIIYNYFQFYARNEFHHLIHDFIFCVPGPALAEPLDFGYSHPGQSFNSGKFLGYIQ